MAKFGFGWGGGTGGGVLGLGPLQNTFGIATTASRAAAKVLLDAYATANAAWLALYTGNKSFWIRLVWNGGVVEQRRNAAGTGWEDVTNVIRGGFGPQGPQGAYDVEIYRNSATVLSAAPTGGSIEVATGVAALPTGWAAVAAVRSAGEETYLSVVRIDPNQQSGTIVPVWSIPIDIRDEMTNAEVKAAYEANPNTNAFTNLLLSKLAGIDTGATDDQTAAEIRTLLGTATAAMAGLMEAADKAKLDGVETGATADQTGLQISSLLDAVVGTGWRSRLAGSDLQTAIDTAVNSTQWRTGHTTLRDAAQTIALIDSSIGTAWKGAGSGVSGITLGQATDAAGALIATLSGFLYDETTDSLTFAIPAGTITPEMLKAGTTAEKNDIRSKIAAAGTNVASATEPGLMAAADKAKLDGAAELAGATFTGETRGLTPVNDPDFATKAYVDAAVAGTTPPSVRSELIYYGLILAANVADLAAAITYAETIDVSTLAMEDATVAGHDITIGPSEISDFFVFLVPAVHDLLTLVNTGTQADERAAYSRSENARNDLGNPIEQYNSYVIGPLNSGVTANYHLTLTE